LKPDNKDTSGFMNSFFNALNEITSQLCIIFKELKNNFNSNTLRKTQSLFYAVIDLLRICELFITWCPELFLDIDQVHSNRLVGYLMFTLNSLFNGEVYRHIEYFSQKTYLHSATLEQFLAPIIGVFAALYNGITRLVDNPQYE
jgi:hypothetical protein